MSLLTGEQNGGLKAGDLVRLAPDATKSEIYTYGAEVLRVVDGDTLWLKVRLRARHWLREKLRLRGLDCPEMDTPEGKEARRFAESCLSRAAAVTITTKPDKWDRYLSTCLWHWTPAMKCS